LRRAFCMLRCRYAGLGAHLSPSIRRHCTLFFCTHISVTGPSTHAVGYADCTKDAVTPFDLDEHLRRANPHAEEEAERKSFRAAHYAAGRGSLCCREIRAFPRGWHPPWTAEPAWLHPACVGVRTGKLDVEEMAWGTAAVGEGNC